MSVRTEIDERVARLSPQLQEQVLQFVSSLKTSAQKGESGSGLAQFAESLDNISAREMTQAIEEDRSLTTARPPIGNSERRSTMSMEQAILEAVRSLPLGEATGDLGPRHAPPR